MRKKYNDESLNFGDWTTKKLKQEAISYDEMINKLQCYGCSDLRMFDGIITELESRGISFDYVIKF